MKPPKFHGVKDHLLDFFGSWYVLGPYNEEFTESDHVRGNEEARMFGALRDISSREQAISRRRQIINHPDVQRVIEEGSSADNKRRRLPLEEWERLKRRRADVLEEVGYFIASQSTSDDDNKISDYWSHKTDER